MIHVAVFTDELRYHYNLDTFSDLDYQTQKIVELKSSAQMRLALIMVYYKIKN